MVTGFALTTPALACALPAAGDKELGGDETVGPSSRVEAGSSGGTERGAAAGVGDAGRVPSETSGFGSPARTGSAGATADWSDGSTAFAGVGVGVCAATGVARMANRARERTKKRC